MPLMPREEALTRITVYIADHDGYIAEAEGYLACIRAGDHAHNMDAAHLEEIVADIEHTLRGFREAKAYLERMHRLITQHFKPGEMVDTGEAPTGGMG